MADGVGPVAEGMRDVDVRLAADGALGRRWLQAIDELAGCVRPVGDCADPILCEGGTYPGSWIEGTGTVSTEVLDRFAPLVSRATHLAFARHCRADGLMPYKLTDAGPGFSQIQIVTPLARSVWKHYRQTGASRDYLRTMYEAMAGMDAWLAGHRDTRGTGGVEAFCTFDTGHDLSPRFWFVPDRCLGGDAARYDPSCPALPYIAPDLTANVACQRGYLALMAAELGECPQPWRALAAASADALWTKCFDGGDEFFYDRAAGGELVRVQSDVLLRVLACEVGDAGFFERALSRYVMNTAKFLSHYGFTSISLDDPRFDHDYTRNSWGGPVNFLTLLRAPQAFEGHGHVAELALVERPVLEAMLACDRFPQCLDPWTGQPGFTDHYSPAILWLLDAVERNMGIEPRPDGGIWFTALPPTRLDSAQSAGRVGYRRVVAGVSYDLVVDGEQAEVFADGSPWLSFPTGWRVAARDGLVEAVTGMRAPGTQGSLSVRQHGAVHSTPLDLPPNHVARFRRGECVGVTPHTFVAPQFG